MREIVLASQSPRRRELLKLIFDDFIICPDDSEENADNELLPSKYSEELSLEKCFNVSKKYPEGFVVIGADTVVVCNDKILGKPHSKQEAYEMLKMLSGKKHSVYTGVTVMCRELEKTVTFSEKTDVYFCNISDEEINNYIESKEPMDKAGSYGIQGKGTVFVERIEGDYNNVVGLPIAKLYKILKNDFGF